MSTEHGPGRSAPTPDRVPAVSTRTIAQISLVVNDIEQATRTYAALFGLAPPPCRMTESLEKTDVRYRGEPTTGRAKLAYLELDNIVFELIEPVGGPSTYQEFLDARGPGVHHIAFHVADVNGTVRRLEAEGFAIVQSGRTLDDGRYTFLEGQPDLGLLIELLTLRT